jgi:hypothetical protein
METKEFFIEITQIPFEEQEKYKGMDVAIIDGKIVAAGHTSIEAFEKAMALFPDKNKEEIEIAYIPAEEWLIL